MWKPQQNQEVIITYLDKVLHKNFLSLKTVKKTTKKKKNASENWLVEM